MDNVKPLRRNILLVSPAPLDGYPPVQYQARILAEEGYAVTILTSYLYNFKELYFLHDNIEIFAYDLSGPNPCNRLFNKVRFLLHLYFLRLRLKPVCEISYDPFGLFFSRLCPGKPQLIIGHLHEILFDPENRFFERFAIPFLRKLPVVVVADHDRAKLLARQINLKRVPLVVRNLPLPRLQQEEISPVTQMKSTRFSVVYHGTVGFTQALDTVIRSIRQWPEEVILHIYGVPNMHNKDRLELIIRDEGVHDRVVFEGWVQTENIVSTISRHSVGFSLLRPENDNWRYSVGASNKRYQLMEAGLPQISDDAPGVQTLIEGNRIGVCVSPEDPEAIAKAINFFYENRDICNEYGERARKLIENEYRYDREFQPLLDVISGSSSC